MINYQALFFRPAITAILSYNLATHRDIDFLLIIPIIYIYIKTGIA